MTLVKIAARITDTIERHHLALEVLVMLISVRTNAAGTKLVYERRHGGTDTHWSFDHTLTAKRRSLAAALLSAKLQSGGINN